jgi:hypothetical protein
MKIRIKGNSLRYRLTRPEVEQFGQSGYIEEKIDFVGNSLYYSLCSTDQEKLSASFYDNQITVYVPASRIEEWKTTEQTGFEGEMDLEDSEEKLHLLVEKDFTCLDKVAEDQSDNYPNPLLKEFYDEGKY